MKVLLVTGSSRGISAEICRQAAGFYSLNSDSVLRVSAQAHAQNSRP